MDIKTDSEMLRMLADAIENSGREQTEQMDSYRAEIAKLHWDDSQFDKLFLQVVKLGEAAVVAIQERDFFPKWLRDKATALDEYTKG
ncbi:MAG: hypothetical protein FWH03_05310 [Firmicutes bacterium]|nr:hypothetical protein [Bacillota bacterium]